MQSPFRARRSSAATVPVPPCRAPAVAMQFKFYGTVHACCENGNYSFGDVRTQSIAEIWEGVARRRMVESLAEGTYPFGCDLCAIEHPLGNRASTPAPPFDGYTDASYEWPRVLEFTLSNRCNLMCVQCNGDNSSTIRKKREGRPPMEMPYGEAFFEQLPPFLDHVEVTTFLGGEPFLAPEARRVWDILIERDLHPDVQVTTNGTVWNDAVERYVHVLRMGFAVSIDGATKETYEAIRPGARYERVLAIRDRMLAAARLHGSPFDLNYCLMPENWHELGRFLLQADELDVHAYVIPVFQPAAHSLFALSSAQLAEVVDGLAAEGRTLRRRLRRNRRVWDTTLGMLRAERERRADAWSRGRELASIRARMEPPAALDGSPADGPTPVAFPTRIERLADLDDPRTRAAIEALGKWAGRPAVEADLEDGIVRAIRAPGWATALAPADWVGHGLDAVEDIARRRLGEVTGAEAVTVAPGVYQRDLVAPSAGARLRTLYVEAPGRLYVACADDLA